MDLKVEPREDEECKEAFEEMKDKLLREFAESSPQGIAEKLLADKIKL